MDRIETLVEEQEPDQVEDSTSLPSKKRRLDSRIRKAAAPSHRRRAADPPRSLASEQPSQAARRCVPLQLNSNVRDVPNAGPSFGSGDVFSLTSAKAGKVEKLLSDLHQPQPCGRTLVQSIEEWNKKLLGKNKEQEDWWFGGQGNDDSCSTTADLLQLASFIKKWDKKHNARRFITLRHIATMVDLEMVSCREAIRESTLAQNQTCRSTAIDEIYNTLKLTTPSQSPDNTITRGEFTKLVLQAEKWKRLDPGFVFCFVEKWGSRSLNPPYPI
jgi:hypothetical protein